MNDKIVEMLELLQISWLKEQDLSLMQILQKIAKEAGVKENWAEISDDVLIYQLKTRIESKDAQIPGLIKDYEEDFKSAILKARGIQ